MGAIRVGDTAWKVLFGICSGVCLAFLSFVFFAAPAWDTSASDFLPNGLGIFVLAFVLSLVAWFLGFVLLFVLDQAVDSARRRRAGLLTNLDSAGR